MLGESRSVRERRREHLVNRLVDDFVRLLEPMMGSASALEMDRLGTSILNDHLLTITNPIQRILINRIAKRLKP
jgi:hypothetical protein